MLVAGSWRRLSRRMQLDGRSRKAEVGRVVECSWMVVVEG